MWGLICCVGILSLTSVHSVEIVEVVDDVVDCQGTHVGFGFSGGPQFHYEALRRRYKGCTYVEGNLEITNLISSANITYDLSFLSQIEVVTGYVLIGLMDVETIPLTSLRLIRADNTYNIMGEDYGLVLALTAEADVKMQQKEENDTERNTFVRRGLVELQLPSLKEISRGKVLFSQNPLLCFVNTINWHVIVPGKAEPVVYGDEAYRLECPSQCDPMCQLEDGTSRCWGSNPLMCQRQTVMFGNTHFLPKTGSGSATANQRKFQSRTSIVSSYGFLSYADEAPVCHEDCPGRCFNSHMMGCCHPECAIGCYGPENDKCEICKYFKYKGRCVSYCPPGISYRNGQDCVEI